MSSTFGGLEMGRSALNAFRLGMQTVGHNISNMNTEGYSRQRVNFATATPEDIPNVGQLGQGMVVSDIERIRDEFLDFQFRDVQSTLGYWEKMNDLYDSIQNYISEPASSGIREAMDTFFTNVQNLQQNPEDTSARQALVTSANSLGMMLGNLVDSFNTYNESINLEVKQAVDDANRMLHNLAHLNLRISNAEALGQSANDLYDQRDLILDKLSKMMDISYNEPLERDGIKGEFFLTVNGRTLVQGTHVRELAAHAFMWDNQVYYDVQVTENEFDIVSNPEIADALATGPEGTYQLVVDRVANGVEWTTGGGDAHCLETYAVKSSAFEDTVIAGGGDDDLMTFKATTSAFSGGNVLTASDSGTHTIAITVTNANDSRLENINVTITRTQDSNGNDIWHLSDGANTTTTSSSSLTTSELASFINSNHATNLTVSANANNTITFAPTTLPNSVKVVYSGELLGTLTEEKGPGVAGTFDVWAGTQGNTAESNTFTGGNLSTIKNGTFRLAFAMRYDDDDPADGIDTRASNDITTELNITYNNGTLSSDFGNSREVSTPPTVDEFTAFLNDMFKSAGLSGVSAYPSDSDGDRVNDTFRIKAGQDGLVSVVDIDDSGLAGALFSATTAKTQTISVSNTDTIATIASKFGSPMVASASKGYLTVLAGNNVMTFKGDDDLLSRLGLTKTDTLSGTDRTVSNVNERGEILNENSENIPYKLQFRSIDEENNPSILTVKIDAVLMDPEDSSSDIVGWKLRAELDGQELKDAAGNSVYRPVVTGPSLTTADIEKFVNEAVEIANGLNPEISGTVLDAKTLNLNARDDNGILNFYTDERKQLEVTDYSRMLGKLTEATQELPTVNMRTKPAELDDALNISGSFRIQVGTQGTRVTSGNFKAQPGKGLEEGEILGTPDDDDTKSYTFRVGVSGDQVDFSATWNDSLGKWILSSDLTTETQTVNSTNSIGKHVLTVKDLTGYMTSVLQKASSSDNPALSQLGVTTGKSSSGVITQFYINSNDNHLLSISDVTGNLAERMGIVNTNPVITIDVESSDSLITIRNKINEKYTEEFGLTEPEQWVHASVDNGYLEISADVAGEAQRITLMGGTDGNMQVLRRLGLTANQQIPTDMKDDEGNTLFSFREVAYIPDSGVAEDASFTLNNVRYLSSDNMFSQARRIPALTGETSERYSAQTLSEVSEGMRLNLKATGSTTITFRHHIKDGTIKALEEIRDGMIPSFKESLDDLAYSLVNHLNAYQYSGYGLGDDITTTGKAFFNQLATKAGAAKRLSVTDEMSTNTSLIGAAMGLKDANGFATKGVSSGNGDGSNASRMVSLNLDKLFENGTMTLGGIYDSMISQIGTEAASAKLLHTTESTVSEQINSQRQAVSGVNLDEELMNMIILNRAFGAMSRYITTYDEMLDKIINGFGLVGR